MLGYDTLYSNSYDDEQIVATAVAEERIILTRDREMLKRKVVSHGYCIRSKETDHQIAEVIKRFQLEQSIKPFSRCLRCNIPLVSVEKKKIANRLPPLVQKYYEEFWSCKKCSRIYWKGSHWEQMSARIRRYLSD
jgi:uncharacterized protein with PIN domain